MPELRTEMRMRNACSRAAIVVGALHRLVTQELTGILIEGRLIRAWIDLGANLTGPHLRVVVAVDVLNHARDISADDDGEHRIDGSGRRHRAGDRPASRWHSDVMHRGGTTRAPPRHASRDGECNHTSRNPATTRTHRASD